MLLIVREKIDELPRQAGHHDLARSDIAPLDLFAQRLDDVADVLKVRVDRQRPAIGFERMFVVTDLLQDRDRDRTAPRNGAVRAPTLREYRRASAP